MADPKVTDAQIIAAIGDGGRTGHVARGVGMVLHRPYILQRLKRLERAGLVRRSDRYTAANCIYWLRDTTGGDHG